jgi:hypothetical protein
MTPTCQPSKRRFIDETLMESKSACSHRRSCGGQVPGRLNTRSLADICARTAVLLPVPMFRLRTRDAVSGQASRFLAVAADRGGPVLLPVSSSRSTTIF